MMGLAEGWAEIVRSWWRQPMRTLVTGATVAWGIFMLILLLAAGTGLENSMRWGYRDDAINSLWVYPGRVSALGAGTQRGRRIQLTDADVHTAQDLPQSIATTARFMLPGTTVIRVGSRTSSFSLRTVSPEHQLIEQTLVRSGRYLIQRDLDHHRKVAVIGRAVATFFWPSDDPFSAPLGELIAINGVNFTVVGVFEDVGGASEEQMVYLPITTARVVWGGADHVDMLMFTVDEHDAEQAAMAETGLRTALSERHGFSPTDGRALRVRNNMLRFADVQQVFGWLRSFTWAVGLGTVLTSVVAVGNILLISVRERTRELGLRKALGATRWDIVRMVAVQGLALTLTAGCIGLVAGLGMVQALALWLPDNDYIRDPSVAPDVAIQAVVALSIGGLVASLVPAWQAARVQPIVALRDG